MNAILEFDDLHMAVCNLRIVVLKILNGWN